MSLVGSISPLIAGGNVYPNAGTDQKSERQDRRDQRVKAAFYWAREVTKEDKESEDHASSATDEGCNRFQAGLEVFHLGVLYLGARFSRASPRISERGFELRSEEKELAQI